MIRHESTHRADPHWTETAYLAMSPDHALSPATPCLGRHRATISRPSTDTPIYAALAAERAS